MANQRGNLTLFHHIQQQIMNSPNQAISFHDFMELCLYHPQYGYYVSERTKIGKEGDFYTSSNVGTIMGEVIARYLAAFIEDKKWNGPIQLVEWGGGTGLLALHILDELKVNLGAIYSRIIYTLVDESPHHRSLQKELLSEHYSKVNFVTPAQWLDEKTANAKEHPCIVLSNELLDAFPIHRIKMFNGQIHELYVTWDERLEVFTDQWIMLVDGPLKEHVQEMKWREGQLADIHMDSLEWLTRIMKQAQPEHILTIDYGYLADELYNEYRMNGTLMCYHQHHAHDNPYIWVGEQDITSHVDFTACIEAGKQLGYHSSLVSQRDFLLQHGVLELLQEHDGRDPFSAIARKNRAIQQLVVGPSMGETFKVLIQSKA